MLGLTESAVAAIRRLVDGRPAGSGLRVALEKPANGTEPEFSLCVSDGPKAGDEVVELEGVRVFLEPAATSYFEDKVLDAADGETFTFAPA